MKVTTSTDLPMFLTMIRKVGVVGFALGFLTCALLMNLHGA